MTTAIATSPTAFARTARRPRTTTDAMNFAQPPRIAMVQDGARLHYAVAAAFERAGQLETMYTDWYNRDWRDALTRCAMSFFKPAVANAMRGRHSDQLDPARVCRMGLAALRMRLARKRFDSDAA